ncbi:hypothetical protein [Agrobacterium tumefaciens]|uniref:hypothetical protein n=1 Tax=Agrobacterium tumefaciens TaxID=358 RepID=UPI0021D18902|nr:hypothetical protein [Agrobacterium tumefaciens]UXS01117.1 hypothetical protein FY156_06235 [Agrobacterium tumefaciens]
MTSLKPVETIHFSKHQGAHLNILQFPTPAASHVPESCNTEAAGIASASVPHSQHSAPLRFAWLAMIASTVRKTLRLIAQPSHPSASSVRTGRSPFGFSEEDHQRFDNATSRRTVSAGKIPQSCGTGSSPLFDVTGLIDWLRKKYPRSTTFHVEAKTGIPAASVENWLHRRSQPSVQHFSILIAVFGPSLLAASFPKPPMWVSEAVQAQRRREIDAQIEMLQRERDNFSEVA